MNNANRLAACFLAKTRLFSFQTMILQRENNKSLKADFAKTAAKLRSHNALRRKSDQRYFYRNVTTCRTKRTEDFFTFKYFKYF